jgi:hypothetical protein
VSLEAAMPKGGETAGGEDPDRQEQQIQIGRPKSEGVFKHQSPPPGTDFCAEKIRRK